MRIFQLAKELNVDSKEILDALEDMGLEAKSNLSPLDDAVVAELRDLFKPKPVRPSKEEALKRAATEREEKERAAREERQREEERRAAAKKAALERAAAHRRPEGAAPAAAVPAEPAPAEAPAAPAPVVPTPAPIAATPAAAPAPVEAPAVVPTPATPAAPAEKPAPKPAEKAAEAVVATPAAPQAAAPAPAPVAPPQPARPAAAPARPAPPPVSRLGKAVIAPPPSTASERAKLLGLTPGSAAAAAAAAGRRGVPPRGERAAAPAAGARRPAAPGAVRDDRAAAGPRRPDRAPAGPHRGDRRGPQGPARGRAAAPAAAPTPSPRHVEAEKPVGEVKVSEGITVKDLSERMDRKAKDVIKRLFLEKGIMATINHALDLETARWVVEAFGGTAQQVDMAEEAIAEATPAEAEAAEQLVSRPPVVTIMGHVDHGKTSLLDAIRATRVAEREAGGITQHIGAYKVRQMREGTEREIVFLDTPGHEAFTLMRARGARVTDIVVLVVAADDGVMPQTLESINHAKAAGVPLVVAVNKIDKANANPERVLQQLAERNVLVEQYGGETVAVQVSAKAKIGLDQLLDMILLVADMAELKSNPARPASGTVLEAKLDRARGPVATILVQNGTLKVGDVFVVGSALGRVRALADERDRRLTEAGPSTPVVVMGLDGVPAAGDLFQVFPDEAKARQIANYRLAKQQEEDAARRMKLPTLETLASRIQEGEVHELPIVVKADVQGSVEVLRKSLEDLSTTEVVVKVIHAGTGAISETDILLASASGAIVVGFNVRPERGVGDIAKREGVDIRLHTVIYNVTDEIKQAMLNTLSPVEKEVFLGRAEVRQVFRVAKVGTIAGCYVVEGTVRRDAKVRLLRDNVVVHEGRIDSLRRFKDDAKEVKTGFECGIGLERYQDLKPGDEIEAFTIELSKRESLEIPKAD